MGIVADFVEANEAGWLMDEGVTLPGLTKELQLQKDDNIYAVIDSRLNIYLINKSYVTTIRVRKKRTNSMSQENEHLLESVFGEDFENGSG